MRFNIGLSALLIFASSVTCFPQDWKALIPPDDLTTVTSGALQKTTAPLDLFQEDVRGCNADKNPGCPLLTLPTDFYKSPDNDKVVFAYQFDDTVDGDPQMSALILEAFASVETATECITFKSATDVFADNSLPDMPTIVIKKDKKNCAGEFGGTRRIDKTSARIEHNLYLNSDCLQGKQGNVQRLLMLALGFPHEHVRSDRDNYISINMDNVIPARKKEFEKNAPEIAYLPKYDYDSVLHPGYVFSAVDPKIPTIVAKTGVKIGQHDQMSEGDAAKIRRLICDATATAPLKLSQPSDDAGKHPVNPLAKATTTPEPEEKNPATPAPRAPQPAPPVTQVQIKDSKTPKPAPATTTTEEPKESAGPEEANPPTGIAPTATQKCSGDLYLRIRNRQMYWWTKGNSASEWESTLYQCTTTWFVPDTDETADFLKTTIRFKDGPTDAPKRIRTEVQDASKRVLRTEYPTLSMEKDGYFLQTKVETLTAQCVPPSDMPPTGAPEDREKKKQECKKGW
ncbi:astacin-like metalloendopeptidase [Paramacrobiotus metropolitanus]|uniref:astacin-like metalloendopeptidase n=1 Tax=Paramacrobiotus metropolitanus TaxID=2943436 RepID=UPI002445C5B4|nr:astacin-like metalloendopeptidase [Paramacrobiotus metropolitanus]